MNETFERTPKHFSEHLSTAKITSDLDQFRYAINSMVEIVDTIHYYSKATMYRDTSYDFDQRKYHNLLPLAQTIEKSELTMLLLKALKFSDVKSAQAIIRLKFEMPPERKPTT